MEKPLNIAVIGVGHLGKHHARLLSEMDEANLVAVVDNNPSHGREIAENFSTHYLETDDDLPDEVEAVSIVTPTETHFELARRALEKNQHVFIEKPITQTVEQAHALIELAKGRERVVQVGHIERFNAAVLELHKHLNDPRFIESHRLGPFTPRVKDVGVVKDLMIHDLDLILSLVQSPVTSVEAVGVSVLTPFEDIANGRLKFENGCIANLTASRVTPEQTRKIRFFQKDAYLSLDYQNHQLEIYRKKMSSDGTKAEIDREIRQMEKGNALQAELASFVEAIRTGKQPLVTGEDGLRALSLAEEISIQIHERF